MNQAIVIDTLLQRDGPPIALHMLGFQPLCELIRVLDRRTQRQHLGPGIDLPQFRQRYLQGGTSIGVVD